MRMVRGVGLVLLCFLVWVGPVFSEYEMKKEMNIEEFVGQDDVYLEPTRFPVFSGGRCKENQGCYTWVEDHLSGMKRSEALKEKYLVVQTKTEIKTETVKDPITGEETLKETEEIVELPGQYMVNEYGSMRERCSGPGEFNKTTGKYKSAGNGGWISLGNTDYTVLELGEEENEIVIEDKKTTKLFFSWRVRAVGNIPNTFLCFSGKGRLGIEMRPLFCNARHKCTIEQDFSGGQVKVRLYIKGTEEIKAKGAGSDKWAPLDPISEMTLPDLEKITFTNESTPGDPTITGSRMVTGDDFEGGSLPDKVYFKLMWVNDSALVAESLGKQRRISVVQTDQ